MIYLVKHWLEALLSPLTLSLLIAAIAVICRFSKRPRLACTLLMVAAAIVYGGSIAVVGDALLGPLERRYPPLSPDTLAPAVRYVVVLGAGYAPRDGVPITAALARDGLVRAVEAVRLARRRDDVQLIVSGGAPPGQSPSALGYAELARDLGIRQSSIVVLDTALDTRAEARAIAPVVGSAPFVLVTSAYHMPRAMLEMRRAGVEPIPAPTDQMVDGSSGGSVLAWLPNSAALRKVERALHEYIGLAALAARTG
jgi:uncharacterized SAM-binding protein YcdF (DUF218 family)